MNCLAGILDLILLTPLFNFIRLAVEINLLSRISWMSSPCTAAVHSSVIPVVLPDFLVSQSDIGLVHKLESPVDILLGGCCCDVTGVRNLILLTPFFDLFWLLVEVDLSGIEVI